MKQLLILFAPAVLNMFHFIKNYFQVALVEIC